MPTKGTKDPPLDLALVCAPLLLQDLEKCFRRAAKLDMKLYSSDFTSRTLGPKDLAGNLSRIANRGFDVFTGSVGLLDEIGLHMGTMCKTNGPVRIAALRRHITYIADPHELDNFLDSLEYAYGLVQGCFVCEDIAACLQPCQELCKELQNNFSKFRDLIEQVQGRLEPRMAKLNRHSLNLQYEQRESTREKYRLEKLLEVHRERADEAKIELENLRTKQNDGRYFWAVNFSYSTLISSISPFQIGATGGKSRATEGEVSQIEGDITNAKTKIDEEQSRIDCLVKNCIEAEVKDRRCRETLNDFDAVIASADRICKSLSGLVRHMSELAAELEKVNGTIGAFGSTFKWRVEATMRRRVESEKELQEKDWGSVIAGVTIMKEYAARARRLTGVYVDSMQQSVLPTIEGLKADDYACEDGKKEEEEQKTLALSRAISRAEAIWTRHEQNYQRDMQNIQLADKERRKKTSSISRKVWKSLAEKLGGKEQQPKSNAHVPLPASMRSCSFDYENSDNNGGDARSSFTSRRSARSTRASMRSYAFDLNSDGDGSSFTTRSTARSSADNVSRYSGIPDHRAAQQARLGIGRRFEEIE